MVFHGFGIIFDMFDIIFNLYDSILVYMTLFSSILAYIGQPQLHSRWPTLLMGDEGAIIRSGGPVIRGGVGMSQSGCWGSKQGINVCDSPNWDCIMQSTSAYNIIPPPRSTIPGIPPRIIAR